MKCVLGLMMMMISISSSSHLHSFPINKSHSLSLTTKTSSSKKLMSTGRHRHKRITKSSSSSDDYNGDDDGDGDDNQNEGTKYSGQATWFIPDTGACGTPNVDGDFIIALNSKQYQSGQHCYRSVWIKNKNNGKTVKAMITDECPTCDYGSLDLTKATFKSLEEDLDIGVLPIVWGWA